MSALTTKVFSLRFLGKRDTRILSLTPRRQPTRTLTTLRLLPPHPALIVVNKTNLVPPRDLQTLGPLFRRILTPLTRRLGLAILSNNASTKIVRLVKRTQRQVNKRFPLINILPRNRTGLPGTTRPKTRSLRPGRARFFLIPNAS